MSDIYLDVTQKIVTALAQGVIPWIKPWSSAHPGAQQPFPINAITGRAYSGINIPLLWAEARLKGYTQDRWLTFNQARKAGGHIRKDEHSTLAVLYKPMSREQQDEAGQPVLDEQGNAKRVQFAILKTHCLFNIEQTEGVENPDAGVTATDDQPPFVNHDLAEQLLIDSRARIDHRPGDEAFYLPIADRIQLPTKPQFNSDYLGPLLELFQTPDSAQSPPLPSAPTAKEQCSDLGKHFLEWLRTGLQNHALLINDSRAKVHTVNGTYFLVTPGIFQRYAMECHEQAAHPDRTEAWPSVQKGFEKMNIHRRRPNGENIWSCHVQGPRKRGKLNGYLMKDSLELSQDGLTNNPFLSLIET